MSTSPQPNTCQLLVPELIFGRCNMGQQNCMSMSNFYVHVCRVETNFCRKKQNTICPYALALTPILNLLVCTSLVFCTVFWGLLKRSKPLGTGRWLGASSIGQPTSLRPNGLSGEDPGDPAEKNHGIFCRNMIHMCKKNTINEMFCHLGSWQLILCNTIYYLYVTIYIYIYI